MKHSTMFRSNGVCSTLTGDTVLAKFVLTSLLTASLLLLTVFGFSQNLTQSQLEAQMIAAKANPQSNFGPQTVDNFDDNYEAENACFQFHGNDWIQPAFDNDGSGGDDQDDGSSEEIALPFTFNLYGTEYSSMFININGNISFTNPYWQFTPSAFPSNNYIMVAPFWGDVDLGGAGEVWYKITPTAVYINWENVGYYNEHTNKRNSFQLIITDGADPVLGAGNNVGFNYGDMDWTTGDASSGNDGLGGFAATVGVNKGDGTNFFQIGRFDHRGFDYDGPNGNEDGVDYLDGQCIHFDASGDENFPPIATGFPSNNYIQLCPGTTTTFEVSFIAPEHTQLTHTEVSGGFDGFNIVSNTDGLASIIIFTVDANSTNVGSHTITFVATDNHEENPLSTTVELTIDINYQICPCLPVLEVQCPGDVILECGQDIENLLLTGAPLFEGSVVCEGGVINADQSTVQISSNDCSSVYVRTWIITLGDITETCTQIITVVDTQGPVFPALEDINVQCLEEVPGPLDLTAVDVCSGEAEVETFTSQTGEPVETCCLSTAFGPGADWSFWLPVLTEGCCINSANWVFDGCGHLDQFADGTAHIYGTIYNTGNPSQQFIVDMWLENKADWTTWSGLGRNYKNDLNLACANADHINWDYYELVGGFSTLTGAGDLAGDVLYLYHKPNNYYFGFQKGIGANNKNCSNGISGWFYYEGFVDGESIEGHGDINSDAACEPVNDLTCVHNTSFTHFYRAEDACGHATIVSHDVIVEDTTAPEFVNCPSSSAIECSEEIPALAVDVTATDNCTGDVTVVYNGEVVVGDACHTIIRRTWTATDICGNTAECVQQIDVVDTTAPVLNNLPEGEITVECSEVPAAADVTATDNCQEVVEVVFTEETSEGNCPGYYTIYRSWYATDSCENSVSFSQTIHVEDTTAPVFDEYEFYTHVECDQIPSAIGATDNCGEATVEITHEEWGSGGCLGTLYRIYTATDECGNTATAEQYIAIQDWTAPELVGVPSETTLECSEVEAGDDGNYFGIDGVYGVDNCGFHFYHNCLLPVTVTYSEEVVATDDNCPSSFDIIRSWTGIDYCENDTTVSVVFHVVDTTAPDLWIPYSYTAECDDELYYGEASAWDNCTSATISVEVDTIAGECPQSYDIVRTFVATDECGNASAPQVQTIFVRDTTAPVFGDYQSYYEFECDAVIVTVDPTATDNCGLVSYQITNSPLSYDGPCFAFYTRTTVATDECGNSATASQTIIIRDTTAPVITGEIEINIPCEQFSMDSGIFISATDNCNEYTIVIDSTMLVSGECAGVYLRYYAAYDICQNVSYFEQIIRLLDETAPVGTEPQDIQVLCSDEIPSFDPNFTDNCGGEVTVEYTGFEVTGVCGVTYTESWTATDNCGNSTTIDRNVTIYDNVNPYFVEFPGDVTISCEQEVPAVVYPLAYDNCDPSVDVELAIDTLPGDCPNERTIIRTFRGVDDCGNQVVESQVITIIDETAPVFGEQPWLYEYECDEQAELIQPSASDNCSEVSYSYVDTLQYEVECFSSFYRLWTAVDACGNASSFWQYIYFIDTTAPVITGEFEVEVPCEEFSIDSGIFVEATDNCNSVEIVIDSTMLVSGECAGVYLRYYTAYDLCQNASLSFEQIIRLTDETAPLGTEPQDITVECSQEIPSFDPNFTDNCGGEVNVEYSGFEVTGICAVSYTESWTGTDNCGNATTIDRIVTIVDTTDPTLYIPYDYTAECTDELYFGNAAAYDNCDWDVTITVSADTTEGDCPSNYVINRHFTATDDCGNDVTLTQHITVQDTTAPVFGDNQYYFYYDCTEEAEVVEPNAWDACSTIELSYNDTSFWNQGTCYYGFTRVWTAVDACGNASWFNQYIYFTDDTAPVITGEFEVEVPCEEFSIESGIFVEATDNCSEYVITIDSTLMVSGECAGVYLRYYTAADVCGNVSDSFEQIVRLTDETAPVGTEPQDITVECGDLTPIFIPEFTDNCGGWVEITYSGFEVTGVCGVSYTESWTGTDNCGNASTVDRVVTYVDTTDPSLSIPYDYTAECTSELYFGDAYAYDSCDEVVDITVSVDTTEGDCPSNFVINRHFTATDDCGNDVTLTQHITFQDTTAPVFNENNENEFAYECIDEIEVVQPEAWDACSTIEYTYNDTVYFSDSCSTSMARIWTATDACGNASNYYQYISVHDDTNPVIVTVLENVYVECASEVPAPAQIVVTDNCDANPTVNVSSHNDGGPDECGNQVIHVLYDVYDNCGNYAYAEYFIYVNDETAPELSECPADIVLTCDSEIPAAADVTATDNCGGEVEVVYEEYIMGEMPAEGSIADCDLLTPVRPEGNPCNYPYDWAMAMFNMPLAHRYYTVSEGEMVRYPNGTAHITATLNNAANPVNGFQLDVWFAAEMDWSSWSTQGFPTSFKADCGAEGENHADWLYFILQAGEGAELTGFGAYTGSVVNLAHAPANNYFGYQLGDGANNYNDADNGFGGWFTYSGSFHNGQEVTSINGAGDFAFELDCCPDYYVVRQWTASDCSGNVSETCVQYITFEGTVIDQVNSGTTVVPMEVSKADLSVAVAPNPADNNTVFTFKSTSEGRAQLEVFDMAGAKVADIYNNNMEAGLTYRVDFNVNSLATGIYMFRLTQNGSTEMGRLVISK